MIVDGLMESDLLDRLLSYLSHSDAALYEIYQRYINVCIFSCFVYCFIICFNLIVSLYSCYYTLPDKEERQRSYSKGRSELRIL